MIAEKYARRMCKDALAMAALPEKMDSPSTFSRGGEAWGDAGANCELAQIGGKWQILVMTRSSVLAEECGFVGSREEAIEWAKAIVLTESKRVRRLAEHCAFEYLILED